MLLSLCQREHRIMQYSLRCFDYFKIFTVDFVAKFLTFIGLYLFIAVYGLDIQPFPKSGHYSHPTDIFGVASPPLRLAQLLDKWGIYLSINPTTYFMLSLTASYYQICQTWWWFTSVIIWGRVLRWNLLRLCLKEIWPDFERCKSC